MPGGPVGFPVQSTGGPVQSTGGPVGFPVQSTGGPWAVCPALALPGGPVGFPVQSTGGPVQSAHAAQADLLDSLFWNLSRKALDSGR